MLTPPRIPVVSVWDRRLSVQRLAWTCRMPKLPQISCRAAVRPIRTAVSQLGCNRFDNSRGLLFCTLVFPQQIGNCRHSGCLLILDEPAMASAQALVLRINVDERDQEGRYPSRSAHCQRHRDVPQFPGRQRPWLQNTVLTEMKNTGGKYGIRAPVGDTVSQMLARLPAT